MQAKLERRINVNTSNHNIIWVEFCNYMPNSIIQEHTHSFFHYLYILEGEGNIQINRNNFSLKQGRIYLVSPKMPHAFKNTSDSDVLSTIEIKFDTTDEKLIDKLNQIPLYLNMKNTPVKDVLTSLYNEYNSKPIFYNEISSIKLMELITYILRSSFKQNNSKKNSQIPKNNYESLSEFEQVIEFIYSNLENEITLQSLSEVAMLEKTYFLKKFKLITGMTPMNFIRNARVEKAKELLVYSDMNITQIASISGFNSIHHFCNTFSKTIGMTPTEYKKENQIYN